VLGGEAGGGPGPVQAVGGYEHGLIFGRLDGTNSSLISSLDGAPRETTRLGLGAGFTTFTLPDGEHLSGHFMATAETGVMLSTSDVIAHCKAGDAANVFTATVALRYAGQFEVVLVPRYQQVHPVCP
jgi:hypothetical protein